MKNIIKIFARDIIYIFLNYVVNYIPCWNIRKLFYILMGLKIGKGSRICMKCIIMSPWNISIGANTMINEYVLLDGRGGLTIGDSCSISMWAILYTASHYSDSNEFQYYSKETKLGNCCWIGTRAVIMPGSVIRDRTIISVNSVFKGISDENAIYVGNPAKHVKVRKINENYDLINQNFLK